MAISEHPFGGVNTCGRSFREDRMNMTSLASSIAAGRPALAHPPFGQKLGD
jgi:hypothetical protein